MTPTNTALTDHAGKPGWWVPIDQYLQQALLPRSGAWQTVRLPSGAVVAAVVLHGRTGWRDGNYDLLLPQPTEWFKPQRYFRGPDDLDGVPEALAAARSEGCGGILRSGPDHAGAGRATA